MIMIILFHNLLHNYALVVSIVTLPFPLPFSVFPIPCSFKNNSDHSLFDIQNVCKMATETVSE